MRYEHVMNPYQANGMAVNVAPYIHHPLVVNGENYSHFHVFPVA